MLNQWSRVERALLVIVVLTVAATMIAAFMAWDMNQAIVKFNRLSSVYNEVAQDLSEEHGLNLYVQFEDWERGIPNRYVIVVAEDQRYHILPILGNPHLFIDGYLVSATLGWNEIDNELTLLRSRLDLGL